MKQLEPVLKWAGGKRWLVTACPEAFRNVSGRHIEPFAGSAAVFFALRPKNAVLADLNVRLIETYKAIRDELEDFETHLSEFAALHSKERYYEVRQKRYRSIAKRGAHFVYLNRVCFNGIYRENLKGQFNVPIGSKTKVELETDDFPAVSQALRNTQLVSSDFERIVDDAESGDFVFLDPPYTTKHNLNGFVKYNQKIFSWDDQIRLAEAAKRAAARGAKVVVSNADHEDVRALYQAEFEVASVPRSNVIAASSAHRGQTTEMLAASFDISIVRDKYRASNSDAAYQQVSL